MSKRIVVLADGTANTVSDRPSNVLRLCQLLDVDGGRQVALYVPGVGTTTTTDELLEALPPQVKFTHHGWRGSKTYLRSIRVGGLAFGLGTESHIRELYKWLAENYEPGDGLHLFGFSRGAFTIRALAGLIYRCGILRKRNSQDARAAMRLYRKHHEACVSTGDLRALKLRAADFRTRNSHTVDIRFLGVWDTVNSVGYLVPKNLPHTRHNPIVQSVRHAVSLGERRSMYAMTTWGGLDDDTRPAIRIAPSTRSLPNAPRIRRQDVKEVWFPGDHSDVGGGHEATRGSPADVSLGWMLGEACACGLTLSRTRWSATELAATIDPTHLHDALADHETWGDVAWRCWWWLVDRAPHFELENEPPPPQRVPVWTPIRPKGRRVLPPASRDGVVTVHRAAETCYPPGSEPWRNVGARFVVTLPVPDAALHPHTTSR